MHQFAVPPRLFITGTDTDVGKTLVAAILMSGTRGKYWKPIQCGWGEATDTQWIKRMTGLPDSHFLPERHCLRQPLSPHAAAASDGVHIGLSDFEFPNPSPFDHLIVEGAGGIMVPLNDRHFMLDLISKLAIPVLLVASSRPGTINHTLLSLDKLRSRQAAIAGVVLNGPANASNREAIEHYGQIDVVAQIETIPVIHRQSLENLFATHFTAELPGLP